MYIYIIYLNIYLYICTKSMHAHILQQNITDDQRTFRIRRHPEWQLGAETKTSSRRISHLSAVKNHGQYYCGWASEILHQLIGSKHPIILLGLNHPKQAGPSVSIAKLVETTRFTRVYGRYTELVHAGEPKPTNITFGHHLARYVQKSNSPQVVVCQGLYPCF